MNGKRIYIVGGSKGGVGKSLVSMSLIDHLQAAGEKVLLIESDTSNPDVWKSYKEQAPSELLDLDSADGWINLVNLCDDHKESVVVVNTAARNNRGVAHYGVTLKSTLEELQRELVTAWVINRQRDSLELLKEYLETLGSSTVHVLMNAYFGEQAKFELYAGSQLRKTIEDRGGRSLLFPELADRVSDDLYSKRLAIGAALTSLRTGNRAELKRWRGEVTKVMTEIAS
jgi:hypothetical protein